MTTSTSPQPGLEEHFEVVQEADRVRARAIVTIFVAAIVITVVAVFVQSKMLDAKRDQIGVQRPAAAPVASRQIGAIHQTLLERDRHGLELRVEQRASLEKWSWIDRDHSLAKIPVERAMDLVVAHPELLTAPAPVDPQSGATP